MGQLSNSFPKQFSYLCEYAFRCDLSCSFCEYPFIFHCLHCSPSCFDPDSLLLAHLWLGLSWIDYISANKRFSSPKTSSRKPYTSSKQQERQKHSAETNINFSDILQAQRQREEAKRARQQAQAKTAQAREERAKAKPPRPPTKKRERAPDTHTARQAKRRVVALQAVRSRQQSTNSGDCDSSARSLASDRPDNVIQTTSILQSTDRITTEHRQNYERIISDY